MKRLPARPSLDHLKKQAKDLLSLYRSHDPDAIDRFRSALPAAVGLENRAIADLRLRLHDAQSCVAREYGFASWPDLRSFVEARAAASAGQAALALGWSQLVYAGDISGTANRARPAVAARILAETPGLLEDDPYLACAAGEEALLRQAASRDPAWVNRSGGPLNLPPLVAVTHSSLLQLAAFGERLRTCARSLLQAGADPNQSVGSRWAPSSLSEPSDKYRLSALYGAAGQNRDPELTELLLQAGADPNDNESLYHSLESPACTRLLLGAGARIAGSNALYRVLDLDNADALRLLLAHGGNPNEPPAGPPTSDWGTPLLWAIRRRRSPAHIAALLEAGADPKAKTPEGVSAHTVALRFGLPHIAKQLETAGAAVQAAVEDQFIAACAEADEAAARRIQSTRTDLPGTLNHTQLRLLPELAALGRGEAVRVMVRLGWPVAITGGDWDASALNHAVFRGDAPLVRFLLEHGASWQEKHGHGDNACGTLSWASQNEPVEGGDWLGCAEALVAHGMPVAQPDPGGGDSVFVGTHRKWFSDEVREYLLSDSAQRTANSRGG
jgi:ankyrin repeat protein